MAKKKEDNRIDELLNELVTLTGNPFDIEYDEKEAVRVIIDIGKVDGAMEFLIAMMGRDIKLYFNAQTDLDRAQIKGAYSRTAWIRGIIKNANEKRLLDQFSAKRKA